MNEIGALLTSFTHLQNIAKALLALRDFEKLNATVMELQGAIITAQQQTISIQQGYAALDTKARDLEAECMRLKNWSTERQKYTCREIATGIFAYVDNDVVADFQHAHKLCCNCFDQGHKSLLHQSHEERRMIGLNCPRCHFKSAFYVYTQPSNVQVSVKPILS